MIQKRCFFLVMLIVILVAVFSVPVLAEQKSTAQPKEGAKGVTKAKVPGPTHSSTQQVLHERQIAEKEKAAKLKNAQRVQTPQAKSSTPPATAGQTGKPQQQVNKQQQKAPASQAEKQKAEKDRAKTMKELNMAVKKIDDDNQKNRSDTSIRIHKPMQNLLTGGG
jgi:hypothetical protein